MLRGFKLDGFRRSNVEMMEVLQRFLTQQNRRGRIPVLIVDEAQELSKSLLEQVRMLSNLEGDGQKQMQFVLAGQPELAEKLDNHEYRALRQRITVRCRLAQLNPDETWNYLHTRLLLAGSDGREIFLPEAVELMFSFTGGIPRLLNSVADNCLLAAYARGMKTINAEAVDRVAQHLELKEITVGGAEIETVHQDVLRASASWREIAQDLRNGAGSVPKALRQYVENLQVPGDSIGAARAVSTVVNGGNK